MNKAKKIFEKLAEKKKRDFLTEEVKDTLAGGAAAVASTVGTFPLDSRATAAQAKSQNIDVRLSDLFKSKDVSGVKNVGKKLVQKNFGGLGPKLLKTVPAAALTFGTFGATKRILDEIDKEASVSKQIKEYGDDVYKMVAREVKNTYDPKNVDKFLNKNLGRLKVRKGGEIMDIQDRRLRSSFKTLNPANKRMYMTLDADTGKAKITKRNKNILTRITRPGKSAPEAPKSDKKNLRNILLGGGALATAGGAGYISGAKKGDDDYVKKKIRSM